MSLLQLKKDYEQFMSDNYSETLIHWAGAKWDISAQEEWVYFEYVGRSVGDSGLSNDEYNHSGVLDITVVASTRFRVNEIVDIVIDMFKGKKIGNTFVMGVDILNTGIVEEINKSYMDFNLQIKMI